MANRNDTETEAEVEPFSTEKFNKDCNSYLIMSMNFSEVENPFGINYDGLTDVLQKGAYRAPLNVLIRLLEFASTVLITQINYLNKDVLDMLAEINRTKKNTIVVDHNNHEGTLNGISNTDCTGIDYGTLSQDTGYGSQLSQSQQQNQNSIVEIVGHSSTQQPILRILRKEKWPLTCGKHRVSIEENDKLTTSFNDIPSIAVIRRLLFKKFDGLARDTLMDSDNLCHYYVPCPFQIFSNGPNNFVMKTMQKFRISDTVESKNGWPPSTIWDIKYHNVHSTQDDTLEISTSLSDVVSIEEETIIGDNIEALVTSNYLQDAENRLHENLEVVQAENKEKLNPATEANGGKKAKKRRASRSRKPFEQLSNRSNQNNDCNTNATFDENIGIEMKRLRVDDEECLIIPDESHAVVAVPCANQSNEFNIYAGYTNDTHDDNCCSRSDRYERTPSPLFGRDESVLGNGRNVSKFFPSVDMAELTSQITNAIEPLKSQTTEPKEMNFLDAIMESGVKIAGVHDDNDFTGNEVSIHVAFLAMLHAVSENKLHLTPTDDESFKVSNVKPEDPEPTWNH